MHEISPSARIPESAVLGAFCVIGEHVVLGENVRLGVGCVLEEGVKLGNNTTLGNHVTIHRGTEIGPHGFIGNNTTLGRFPRPSVTSTVKVQADLPTLKIGENATIGCSVVLFAGSVFEDFVMIGDCAMVREGCLISDYVVIGARVSVENQTSVGAYTKIQTGSYITAYMEIEDHVFIAPMVTTTNDNFMGRTEKRHALVKGATIKRGARVGGGSILLPSITVAEETFIAAGALVTKDTPEKTVVLGFPAKALRDVPEEELLP